MIRISKIAILISTLVLLNFSADKQVNCLCTNLLQCLAMGAEVIKPRFITNIQGFNDRNYYKDEYKSDANIKGQLISKGNSFVFKSTKKPMTF